MKSLMIILFLLLLSGCNDISSTKGIGELRHKLFTECMELSAKITRSSDDDVSNIVEECDDHAYYTANHITRSK